MLALVVLPALSAGQDAQSDQAQALLTRGIAQYKALQYSHAKATLLQASQVRDKLSDSQRKSLDLYLTRVDDAVKKQAAAQEAFDAANAALKANELDQAAKLFDQAAASPFLPDPVRKGARAQRALVAQKIKAAKAAKPVAKPVAKPALKPTLVKVVKTKATPVPSTDKRLKELERRFEIAKTLKVKGDEQVGKGEIEAAIASYEASLKAFAAYPAAQQALAKARGLQAEAASPGMQAITRLEKSLRIRKRETEVRYDQALRRARESLQGVKGAQDYRRAGTEVRHAVTLLAIDKSLFTDAEYRQKKTETDQLLNHIASEKNAWELKLVREQERAIKIQILDRQKRMERERSEKIDSLKKSARGLRDQDKYAEAVEVLNRVRQLDPDDTWAREQHRVLRRFVLLLKDKTAHNEFMREEEKQMVGVREASIPWYELLKYPRDWLEITERRKSFGSGDGGESEANRAVHRALRQVLPKLNFSGIALSDVIQFIRDVSNTSIHVKWEMLSQASIDKKSEVNVQLSRVTVEKALKTILDDVGALSPLGFIVDEGVITISTKDDLATLVATRVYDISDLAFQPPNFAGPRIDLSSSGNGSGNNGGGSGGGLFGDDDDDDYDDDDDEGLGESRQELIDNILDLIRSVIAPETWRDGPQGGTTGAIRELNGQIIVTQTPENHRKLQDLLAQLREARAMLINVEARFITVNTGFLNRIGIDLDFYFNLGSRLNVDRMNLPTTSAIDPVTGAVVPSYAPSTWTSTTGRLARGNDYFTPVGVKQGHYAWVNAPMDTGLTNSIGAVTNSAMSFAGTFLDDVQVDFLVSATQAHQSTRTLTAPRVTIFNGQRAYVAIQEQQAYVAELEAEAVDNVVAYTPVIGTVSTGSVLDVEGVISADRRYVNMTLRPQVSTIIGFTEYLGDPNVPGSGLVQLPNISLQEVQCTVSVPDGGTLLLGGQRLAGEREREMGVPILAKIPVLNRIFENRQLVRDQQTLLMLVKPTIIIQNEYERMIHPPR